jgi:nicotinamidase-related amidase
MSELRLNAKSTAVVIIDLQRGITSRDTLPHTAASVIEHSAEIADRFRRAGALIVLVRVDLANIVQPAADEPMRNPSDPPPPASASQLVDDLGQQPSDLVITKRYWDAFVGTELEQHLRERQIRSIILTGIATNFGVESTARTAAALGFDVVVVENATSSRSEEAHRFAIKNIFPRLGRVRLADELQPQ